MLSLRVVGVADAPEVASVRIIDHLPTEEDYGRDNAALIICPWLRGLPADTGPWLAALCVHDCNAFLEDDWTFAAAEAERARSYFGIFALDRLRSTDRLFSLLRQRGIDGIVNFPSISFFDGAMAQGLAALGFSGDAEARVLAEARATGLRIGACSRSGKHLSALPPDIQFHLVHDGPGKPLATLPVS
jgi:predicted TIM-barrel enzyme